MSRIKIKDLPNDLKISREEMINITGGCSPDLVYLDVWQRNITAIEDPEISEVATGGPSTGPRQPYRFNLRKKSIF